jgi:prepilin-type N-terminal cleavage/methylation domain-containing protein
MYLQHRKQRGFTLIEVMIASVVALMLAAAVISLLVALLRWNERSKLEQQEAQELVQLATAFKTYNPNNKLGWALGSRTETQVTTLMSAGHLPATFGARHGSTSGRTP